MSAPIADRIHPIVPLAAIAAATLAIVTLAEAPVLMLALAAATYLVLAALSALDRPQRTRRR